MAQQAIANLQTQANTIRNETSAGANTAVRVGGAILDVLDSMLHSGTLALSGPATLAQITSNQNDYATTTSWNRASSDAARNVTGLSGGAVGVVRVFVNVGAFAITFQNQNAGSTAANRFDMNVDVVLGAGQCCAFIYDSTLTRWKLFWAPHLPLSDVNPVAPANTAAPGTAAAAARQDHVHPIPLPSIITDATTARTFLLTDANNIIRFTSASAINATVPPNSSVAYAIGTTIVIRQAGTAQVTLVAGGGVTLNTSETLKTLKQHATIAITKVATDTWDVTGEREAAP